MIGAILRNSMGGVVFNGVPWDRLREMQGWGKTVSGESVTEETALSCGAWFCAIDLISSDIGSLGIFVYRRMTPSGKEAFRGHPAYKIVHDLPNRETTAFDFYKLMVSWKLGWGNAFAEVERRKNGQPVALWPIHPSRVTVERARDTREIVYRVRNDDGTVTPLDGGNIIHVKNYSRDGLTGLSLVALARNAIGLSVTAEKFGGQYFANSAMPNVVLKIPGQIDDETIERLRASWMRRYSGENRNGVAVLEAGQDIEKLDVSNEDAQWLATRQFQILEVSRFTHVPPHKLMEMGRATWGNVEQLSIEYVQMALMPHVKAIEQEFTRKLTPEEDVFCEFHLSTLLRSDFQTRQAGLHIMRQDGIISANEWRALENMNPQPGDQGDTYIVPVNMQSAESAAVTDPDPAPQPDNPPDDGNGVDDDEDQEDANRSADILDKLRPIVNAAVSRMARIESDKAGRAVKKPDTYRTWVDAFCTQHAARFASEFEPVLELVSAAIGNKVGDVATYLYGYMADLRGLLIAADAESITKTIDKRTDLIMEMMRNVVNRNKNGQQNRTPRLLRRIADAGGG